MLAKIVIMAKLRWVQMLRKCRNDYKYNVTVRQAVSAVGVIDSH